MAHTSNAADSALQQRKLELVFVYGSLKQGMANHRQLAGAAFAGTAVLQGLALYDLGPFPMAVASPEPGNRLWASCTASTDHTWQPSIVLKGCRGSISGCAGAWAMGNPSGCTWGGPIRCAL